METVLKIERIDPQVPLPSQGYEGDVAYDIYASETLQVAPGERAQVPTGITMEIPEGYAVFIWDRSGVSHKHGLKTLGGVIDHGFRGEIKVGIINLSKETYTIEKYHRIAQFIVQKNEQVTLVESKTQKNTQRGENAFGSSGK